MLDPEVNDVRTLATRHGISIKRVDAILRLKGLEESWKKVRILLSVSACVPGLARPNDEQNRLVFKT